MAFWTYSLGLFMVFWTTTLLQFVTDPYTMEGHKEKKSCFGKS